MRTVAITHGGSVSNYLSYSGTYPGDTGLLGIFRAPFTLEFIHSSTALTSNTEILLRDALNRTIPIGSNFRSFQSPTGIESRIKESYSFNDALSFDQVITTEPPPTETPIPDYIPQKLPDGIPDPGYPDPDPKIPDFIPQKLPAGVPDPVYPGQDPDPGPDPDPGRDPDPEDPPNEPEKPPPAPGPDLDPPPDPRVPPPDPGRDPGQDPGDNPNREPIRVPGFDPNPYDPIGDPGTDPGEPTPDLDPNPGQDPIQDPTNDPNRDPFRIPGWDPTGDPFRDPFRDPRRDPFRDPVRDPGRDPIDDPGRDPRLDPWRDPGYNPGEDPGDYPRIDPGDDPARDPGEDPRRDEDDFPWRDPIRDPIDDPGPDPGDDPSRDPGNDPGTDPDRDPIDDPGRDPRDEQDDPGRDNGNNDNTGGDGVGDVDPGHPGNDECHCIPIIQIRTVTVEKIVERFKDMPCNYRPPEYVALPVKVLKAVIPVPNTNLKIAVPGSQNITVLKGTEGFARTLHDRVYEIEAWVKTRPDVDDPANAGQMVKIEVEVPDNFDPIEGILKRRKVKLDVPSGHESLYQQHFKQMMEQYQMLCDTFVPSQRGYQILGGDEWYPKLNGKTSPTPIREDLFDGQQKAIAQEYQKMFESPLAREQEKPSKSLIDWLYRLAGSNQFRSGVYQFPADVPPSLMSFSDDEKPLRIEGLSQYLNWYIKQFDALVGQFPIEIEIQDSDPLKSGDQTLKVELPNISEALAEMYGLAISASSNADVAIQFLMRLSAEVMATKNAAIVAGDFARGNASFLGYKGNPKERTVDYSFNPAKLDDLANFLQNSKGKIVGWQEDDPESVVGFLQRIVFAAGLIKAVFFRNQNQMDQLKRELAAYFQQAEGVDEDVWRRFLQELNDPSSQFNQGVARGDYPMPEVDNKPASEENRQ